MKQNEDKRAYELKNRLGFYIFIFRLAGVDTQPQSSWKLYNVYASVALLCAYGSSVAIAADMFLTDDLQHIMENMRALLGSISAFWMQNYVRFRKDAILKLMGLTDSFKWDESPAKDCHTGKTSKGSLIPVIKNSVWKSCLFVIAFHGSYFILQVSLGRRILSINSYYPFDWTLSPLYELVNITQFVAASVYVCTIFGFLGLYATFTCIACTQLEKLRANIYNIRQKHDTTEQDSGAETDQEEEGKAYTTQQVFCHMQKQLNDCIRHHQEILKFMWELEKTMNPMLVVQFVIILAGLCLSAFSLVTNMGDVLQMAQALLIYFGFMTEVCCICWFGDELTEEAESIRDAAWGCDWVGTPVTFQRCILFIIVAANKKFELTAGKIVGVSNNTMANIFNQTLSYLTFLIQAKDNID